MTASGRVRDVDRVHMRRAIALARRGLGHTAPNPMVGAVLVREGKVVGEGFHAHFGGPHAEVEAIRDAGPRAEGATLYVTLEPCAHHGKTPPCADAVIAARIRRVVIAVRDPYPPASGGAERLERAGIEVRTGVEEARARELIAAFLHGVQATRPFVTLKLAVSMDAAIADAVGGSRWITGPKARREVHRLRAAHDAVAVGIGTVLADDPLLTVRGRLRPRVPPARVIFDRQARLPLTSRLVAGARDLRTIVVMSKAPEERVLALRKAGVTVLEAEALAGGLEALHAEGVRSLLVEGGARFAGACLDGPYVDRLVIFQAPVILGAGALGAFAFTPASSVPAPPRWQPIERRRLGADLMTVYAPQESVCSPES
jgi:diaminohydroxyphosphoribosylaminopyrimidine deaminase / 5-amino-6-(5-phosphoribosylamino)uracil reductase